MGLTNAEFESRGELHLLSRSPTGLNLIKLPYPVNINTAETQ